MQAVIRSITGLFQLSHEQELHLKLLPVQPDVPLHLVSVWFRPDAFREVHPTFSVEAELRKLRKGVLGRRTQRGVCHGLQTRHQQVRLLRRYSELRRPTEPLCIFLIILINIEYSNSDLPAMWGWLPAHRKPGVVWPKYRKLRVSGRHNSDNLQEVR